MRNGLEILGQVGINDMAVPRSQGLGHRIRRIMGRPTRPEALRGLAKVGLEDRFDYQLAALCTTRSLIVGIPSGRWLPSGWGIQTRRTA
jgi:hypothetical protein